MTGISELGLVVNGEAWSGTVSPRLTLCDFLRGQLRLTGTHAGCEQGVCGACTVLVDGEAVRSCLMLAVQADGADVTTVEGMSAPGRCQLFKPHSSVTEPSSAGSAHPGSWPRQR